MPRSRRVIVTLHGINSAGTWQDEVAKVFEPHFRCVPLRYPQFRRLGWLKIFNPWLRRKALKTVAQKFFAEIVVAGIRPHLIAHSFGTWIAAQLIKRPGTRFNRVVFVGSPLPAHFNWAKEMKDNPGAFYDLTNERGLRDGVISLAGMIGKGRAGTVGFKRPSELIHDTGVLRDACRLCRFLDSNQLRIHNVHREFRHSDWFVGSGHSANLWLPYFWGFSPEEYSEFIETCLRLDEMEGHDVLNLRQEEEALRERGWSWTRKGHDTMSLSGYIESNVAEYLRQHNRQADMDKVGIFRDLAIQSLWAIVGEAIEERRKPAAERQDDIVLRLHPKIAISAAIAIAADS
jgi:pimeloyl-ACP methyl ester carboxylesterase